MDSDGLPSPRLPHLCRAHVLVPCLKAHVEKSVCLVQHQHIQTLHTAGQVQTLSFPPEHVLQAAWGCHNNVPALERKFPFTSVLWISETWMTANNTPTDKLNPRQKDNCRVGTVRPRREERTGLQARTLAKCASSIPQPR